MKKFPNYQQTEAKDCGPTCIKIISKYYGKTINTQQLRSLSETTREGSSLLGLSNAVESMGFKSLGIKLAFNKLKEAPLPCILHWNKNHYVVLYKIKKDTVYISDPAHGLITFTKKEFIQSWIGNNADENTEEGIALLIEPTPKFYQEEFEEDEKFGFSFIFKYLFKYKKFIVQLIIGLLAGSLLQLILPFLTQSIVDVGIKNQDLNFIYLILFAQLFLFVGKASLEIIRSWILLHLSTRINISLISDFFIKLMKLPISYFDVRMTGDLLQRINDHKRIERILTTSSLTVLFSFFNLIIFSLVLGYYSLQIFGIFVIGSVLYFGWVLFFFKKRKELDHKQFSQVSQEQSKVIELINGMQEIKLHNAERRMRWNWEYVQASLFKVATKSLALEQTQSVGSNFINELKNMFITILSAKLVIDGDITLGMMMAISYIVGQLNGPITQLINFMRDVQDAQISIDRLGEIHNMEDEEKPSDEKMTHIPENSTIKLNNISFRYTGGLEPVLHNLSLEIPANKTTAIVGASGSGKTTLMKLLLGFYQVNDGDIMVDNFNLKNISQKEWRRNCGVVMQEGYIFNDSIAKNIAVGEDYVDKEKLAHAINVANISDYIDGLPLGYNTKIGSEGNGLSTGQKQRLLIARSVYKNPKFLFFDEATSALDANNEKVIMGKLNEFFADKTAVVIAHRLSTVKNAHQIVVLDKGKIIEKGTHEELIKLNGSYYHLVKNQLNLGK
ncbi:peptidase domain-containing ABC transporter [Tenacibaculum finnmarkense]|uniref:peptidase domain-containing ABC transporter n=1 Tax=Tenacibaculum finnmarkense TaxID=2781243 RepID=UPI001EFC0B63|nr:peptidase domain-containing ABC transporter [Tenacibaculum finnmarkense]MCG8207432.1 peptidase domain-containing ABC transporter [Tenacibaculum finnmarkense genomovar finnmarkense]MCG8723543.1 peptidase domain-containing ABC transporter [Tenacibaculum finnmarkense]MCG8741772.1 peptidase domain-containing ABC transporter [Tenacibaculum finnmarkense]MCG8765207.1 peptidase domain-containing ABC transporter [Tenacibaculum finnmarkense]MCG8777989.1 peptidase domain-containing ABC transporter [Te